jgi:hypothetical protein
MTTSYLKLNLSYLEHYYHLFYLDKYHKLSLSIINDSEIVSNADYEVSKKYIDNKMNYELFNNIFKKNKIQELKNTVQTISENQKKD